MEWYKVFKIKYKKSKLSVTVNSEYLNVVVKTFFCIF